MTKRAVLAAALVLFAALLPVAAQPSGKVTRVGYLSTGASVSEPFRRGLRELGYIEGQNLVVEARLAAGKLDQLPALAADLVRARVDMIVAASPPAIQAAKDATTSIPIVMAFASDPVQSGFVRNLARPGGNITGVSIVADEISGKRLALLKEMLPRATRIAVFTQAIHSSTTGQPQAARDAAKKIGVDLDVIEVRDPGDFEMAIATIAKSASGLLVVASPMFTDNRNRLTALAAKHRLPTLCAWREMAEAGCLMAYGPNFDDLLRRAAAFVDRIARGTKPYDLPVEQPMNFELTINLKTAKALGLTVPKLLLLQAEHIIQ